MAAIILTYRLLPGVTPADFENWVRTTDQPAMRGIERVKSMDTFRVTGLLMGEGEPSVQYVEVFDVPDIAGFDRVYKKLIQIVELFDVSSSFAMEEIKYTTALPLSYV